MSNNCLGRPGNLDKSPSVCLAEVARPCGHYTSPLFFKKKKKKLRAKVKIERKAHLHLWAMLSHLSSGNQSTGVLWPFKKNSMNICEQRPSLNGNRRECHLMCARDFRLRRRNYWTVAVAFLAIFRIVLVAVCRCSSALRRWWRWRLYLLFKWPVGYK